MKKKPAKYRHKHKAIGLRIDEAVIEKYRQLAKNNRRTFTAEVTLALEEKLRLLAQAQ